VNRDAKGIMKRSTSKTIKEMSAFAFSMEEEDHTISLPAFFAARESSSSIKLCAGSPSGNRSIKFSTCRTTSSLLRY
jgi:hypothetical protein